jgi:hypothetical protein
MPTLLEVPNHVSLHSLNAYRIVCRVLGLHEYLAWLAKFYQEFSYRHLVLILCCLDDALLHSLRRLRPPRPLHGDILRVPDLPQVCAPLRSLSAIVVGKLCPPCGNLLQFLSGVFLDNGHIFPCPLLVGGLISLIG